MANEPIGEATSKTIKEWWDEFRKLTAEEKPGGHYGNDTVGKLKKLAEEVGASPLGIGDGNASITELTHNIHQALQTASMIDACRTAAKNRRISVGLLCPAVVSALAALAACIAAWTAACKA